MCIPSLTALAGTVQSLSCLQALRTDPETDRRTDARAIPLYVPTSRAYKNDINVDNELKKK